MTLHSLILFLLKEPFLDCSLTNERFDSKNAPVLDIPDPVADGSTAVRFRSFVTPHEDTEITRVKDVWQGLTVSPDRKTILFSALARVGSNIMVVDNFR